MPRCRGGSGLGRTGRSRRRAAGGHRALAPAGAACGAATGRRRNRRHSPRPGRGAHGEDPAGFVAAVLACGAATGRPRNRRHRPRPGREARGGDPAGFVAAGPACGAVDRSPSAREAVDRSPSARAHGGRPCASPRPFLTARRRPVRSRHCPSLLPRRRQVRRTATDVPACVCPPGAGYGPGGQEVRWFSRCAGRGRPSVWPPRAGRGCPPSAGWAWRGRRGPSAPWACRCSR